MKFKDIRLEQSGRELRLTKDAVVYPEYLAADKASKELFEEEILHFVCLVCSNIVSEPRQCSLC